MKVDIKKLTVEWLLGAFMWKKKTFSRLITESYYTSTILHTKKINYSRVLESSKNQQWMVKKDQRLSEIYRKYLMYFNK